ncbi:MAG: hypothetical protein ABIH03_04895 [Pseudomonadota bacterium]
MNTEEQPSEIVFEEEQPSQEDWDNADSNNFRLPPEGYGLFEIVECKLEERSFETHSGFQVNYRLEQCEPAEHDGASMFVRIPMFNRFEPSWVPKKRMGIYKKLNLGSREDYCRFNWATLVGHYVVINVKYRSYTDKNDRPRTAADADGFVPFLAPEDWAEYNPNNSAHSNGGVAKRETAPAPAAARKAHQEIPAHRPAAASIPKPAAAQEDDDYSDL